MPLNIPPGVVRTGTALQSAGRWRDASLVRWREGVMMPIGGWSRRGAFTLTGVARGALAWRENGGARWIAAGTAAKLYVISASNSLFDITPAGLTAGYTDATSNTGYGGGFYGLDNYGTPRAETSNPAPATTWSLDSWGQNLLACSDRDGKIYEWALNTAVPAAVVSGAPTGCVGIVVTEERFVFALGAGGTPRRVQWCDQENDTVWTPTATNQAGDFDLQTPGTIMQGIRTTGQTLILTDQDAHVANYLGPPLVYGFRRVGTGCGAISKRAAAAVDAGVYWMGAKGFYRYAGGTVEPVSCDVDAIFGELNSVQQSKVYAVSNTANKEIWWFYPSNASSECDSYVALDYKTGEWMVGKMARTCGIDAGVFRDPTYFAPDGTVYSHETGFSYSGGEVFAESGPFQIGAGDQVLSAVYLIPDEKTQGDCAVTFKTRFHPNNTERSYGPYSLTNPTSVRFTGRQVTMRVTGARLTDWRFGIPRLDVRAGGLR